MFIERTKPGRVRINKATDGIPKGTEAELIDGDLWFFFPDGTIWLYDDDTGDDEWGKMFRVLVH